MKFVNKLITFVVYFSFIIGLVFSANAFAKEINLYDQPQDNAKVVGKVDLSIGIIPIFTPKEGTWMKVGDPRNGDVGWIKSSDITSAPGAPTSFTFTQRITSDKNGVPHSYEIIQYGNQQPKLNNQQMQDMVQKMQEQQRKAQEYIHNVMQNMMNDLNSLYKQEEKMMSGAPIIMPVIITPAAKKPAAPVQKQATTPSSNKK